MAGYLKESTLWPNHFPLPEIGWQSLVESQVTAARFDGGTQRVRQIARDFPQNYQLKFKVRGMDLVEEMLAFMAERVTFFIKLPSPMGHFVNAATSGTTNTNHLVRALESPRTNKIGFNLYEVTVRWYVAVAADADASIPI